MKRTFLIAAAAALLMATPAAAQGYLGLEYANVDISLASDEADKWQGEGAFGWNAGGGLGFQLGASVGNIDFGGGDVDFWTLDGHVYFDGGGWRIGALAATTQLDASPDLEETVYGVEGMFDFAANGNVYGSYTVGETDFIMGADFDTWNFDAGVNFYVSPNIRLGAMAGVGNIEAGGADADTNTYGIDAEFMPWAVPVSFTVGWSRYEIDGTPLDSDTIRIGARWNFGGATLQERNNAVPFTTHTGVNSRLFGIY